MDRNPTARLSCSFGLFFLVSKSRVLIESVVRFEFDFREFCGALIRIPILHRQYVSYRLRQGAPIVQRPVECFDKTGFTGTCWAEQKDVKMVWHIFVVEPRCVSSWQHRVLLDHLADVDDLLAQDLRHNGRHGHAATASGALRLPLLHLCLDLAVIDDTRIGQTLHRCIDLKVVDGLIGLEQLVLVLVNLHLWSVKYSVLGMG